MISTGQILAAAIVTGIAVALAAAVMRWSPAALAAAALSSFALLVVWRWISNLLGLNGDYLPAISIGDTGCLIVGALGPAAVARLPWFSAGTRRLPAVVDGASGRAVPGRRPDAGSWNYWLPALVGGVVGFVINVVIL
jgi:hypothetical protein